MSGYNDLRKEMVERQIKARGVRDPLVLDAMARVPRERFVPDRLKGQAYWDRPLPIDAGQTISQPYIVAYMIEALALKGGEKVLEIGAGSGYAAAVLAEIASEVYTIERHGTLAAKASTALQDAGYTNFTSFMVTAPGAGKTRRRSMLSLYRPEHPSCPKRSSPNWPEAGGWWCPWAATRVPRNWSASRGTTRGSSTARIWPMCASCP